MNSAVLKALILWAAIAASCTSAEEIANAVSPGDPGWPTGSKLVGGAVCFEHEVAGEWVPLVLVSPQGIVPVRTAAAYGDWRIPTDAGSTRVLIGCVRPRAAPPEESGP